MPRLFAVFLLTLLLPTAPALAALIRWDALPALDVAQTHGPYAGQTMCPMCRHGYDAGVLILLPGEARADTLTFALGALREATGDLDDPRFRIFVVLLDTPTTDLRNALDRLPAHWHAGTLLATERAAAEDVFGKAVTAQGSLHVFAQRRVLRSVEALQAVDAGDLAADVAWAREVLDYTYAVPAGSEDPDTPKGLLWSAPSRPAERLALQPGSAVRRLCFESPHGGAEAAALAGLRVAGSSPRTQWARTDDSGCVEVELGSGGVDAELFAWRARPVAISIPSPGPAQSGLRTGVELPRLTGVRGNEPVVGGRCDGCEAVFTGLPDRLVSVARLVAEDEPGEPLRIRGRVLDAHGRPRAGVVVYAYQTDAAGHYPPAPQRPGAAARHGRLHGWAISDAQGRYGFDSVRPASYPDSSVEQHVHMHVIEPGRCTYYLGDLLFDDDPRLSAAQRQAAVHAHGGSGVVRPTGDASGWEARRDIHLGANVADHARCGERPTSSSPAQAPSARPRPAIR